MVALKHKWKPYLEPFSPAILREDLHHSNDGILESTMHQNRLEPSEEDLLVYTVGNEDEMNQNEEQRLKNLANGSNEGDSESSDEEGSDDDNHEDDDDRPTRFEGGRSRSDRMGGNFREIHFL